MVANPNSGSKGTAEHALSPGARAATYVYLLVTVPMLSAGFARVTFALANFLDPRMRNGAIWILAWVVLAVVLALGATLIIRKMRTPQGRRVLYGTVAIGLPLSFVVLGINFFAHAPKIDYNAVSAIGSIRTLAAAQHSFRLEEMLDADGDGTSDFGTLVQLASYDPSLIDQDLATGIKNGYVFELKASPSNGGEPTFSVTAVPEKWEYDDERSFYVDQSGVIRFDIEMRTAGPKSPPVM